MRIYLDDERNPKVEKFDNIVRDFDNFEYHVQTLAHYGGQFTYISFDHDLGLGKNGYDCAKYLVDADTSCNVLSADFTFNVHSANPVGAKNIQMYMDQYLSIKKGETI